MTAHQTGTREQWLRARRELLEREKELTRRSDELARERQRLLRRSFNYDRGTDGLNGTWQLLDRAPKGRTAVEGWPQRRAEEEPAQAR